MQKTNLKHIIIIGKNKFIKFNQVNDIHTDYQLSGRKCKLNCIINFKHQKT